MKSSWFVTPEIHRIELDEGQWIEIKKQLNVGESRRLATAGFKNIKTRTEDQRGPGTDEMPEVGIDWPRMSMARVKTYLIDWSICDENDKRVKVTEGAIEALDPDKFTIIDEAIDKYLDSVEEEKKVNSTKRGEQTLKAI